MTFTFLEFKELDPAQLHDVFKLRQDIFIIEQACLYDDIDGYDKKASHLLGYQQNELVGYLRILGPEIKFSEPSLGRILIKDSFRGKGLGSELVKEGITKCFHKYPDLLIRIEAQSALLGYYNQLGFKEEGSIYPVDGIDHIQMVLNPH